MATQPTLIGTPAFWNPNLQNGVATSLTTLTVPTGSSNIGLVVVTTGDASVVPGSDTFTWNGVAADIFENHPGSNQSDFGFAFWANPATGNHNLTYTANGHTMNQNNGFIAFVFQDVAQTSTEDVYAHDGAHGATTHATVNITPSVDNTTIIATVNTFASNNTRTPDGSQVAISSGHMAGGSLDSISSSYLTVPTAGLNAVGYTFSSSSCDMFAISLKSPAAGGGVAVPLYSQKSLLGVGA